MKTILFRAYGGPEVLEMAEVSDPHPGPNEVRIRVRAAGVNPVDSKIRRGLLQQRLPHVLPIIPGWDVAGEVDAVGDGVTRFRVGDAVFAYARKPVVQFGAYAEYIVLPENQAANKPVRASHVEAASIPLAALTAWQSLFDAAGLRAGQSVLIHAGAGGVGGFAIQLAKQAGATVITTAGPENHAYVRSLGADEVIDYRALDFRAAVSEHFPGGVDVAYDTVGGDVQTRSADVVKPGGVLVSILAYADEAALRARGIETRYVFVAPNREQLAELAARFDAGTLTTRIAGVLPLSEAATAHRQIETGHTAGKLVLRLD
ncbi:MAG TPA: NADP-dependent oxidoreductase [Kiritimatiellia bacterium]|mgnify:CR=1 FL=1|nr:NADP-dependent oxidoreductase [Kiritimatiellia bacterium]HMO98243.1 NADP-dependent oxidoreductase [Kiritimatiellia bacterium]HMP96588.1 NADP-dependent oxidoreductase [Kiritimatiellia bacterium]